VKEEKISYSVSFDGFAIRDILELQVGGGMQCEEGKLTGAGSGALVVH